MADTESPSVAAIGADPDRDDDDAAAVARAAAELALAQTWLSHATWSSGRSRDEGGSSLLSCPSEEPLCRCRRGS